VARAQDSAVTRLLSVGRHEGYKRLELLGEIVRLGRGHCHLTLVTDARGLELAHGPWRDLVAKGWAVVKAGLSAADLAAERHSAHVYVQPSLIEGYCLPACEALAAGLPVIHVHGSGIDEVVDRRLGIALPSEASPAEWLNAIEGAAAMACEPQFVQVQQSILTTKPSWDDIAARVHTLYDRMTS
jgi:glycosyltransferase involved in cell wall biosynthesis